MFAVLHLHTWHWSPVEWATVLGTLFTAAAATAAWRSALVAVSLERSRRVPQVSGAVLHNVHTGRISLTFANAGPVLAVQVMYMLVIEGWMAFGLVGDGHLRVDEKIRLTSNIVSSDLKAPSYLVWGWRDLDDNVYQRTHDWKTVRIPKRRYLKRDRSTLAAMFDEMYPGVSYAGCVKATTEVE
jgi:hypothetical protein